MPEVQAARCLGMGGLEKFTYPEARWPFLVPMARLATEAVFGHVDHLKAAWGHGGRYLAMGALAMLAMSATRHFVNIFMEGEVALAAAAEPLCPGSRRTNIM